MLWTEVAIFYKHQTSGRCVGMYACDRTNQMKKTATYMCFNYNVLETQKTQVKPTFIFFKTQPT